MLCSLYESDTSPHVYFQPPENIQMQYPAIVYERYSIENKHGDNKVFEQGTKYQVVIISKDPDEILVEKVSMIPTAKHVRHYVSDKLNHDVFYVAYK